LDNRISDLVHISDANVILGGLSNSEVFSEGAEAKLGQVQFTPPIGVVFGGIRQHSLVGSAMNAEICLGISLEVQPAEPNRPANAVFED
jgi:hypothetical protein